MKTLKKYAYQSPETEVLSLESGRILQEISPTGPENPNQGGTEGPVTGGLQAPWRY